VPTYEYECSKCPRVFEVRQRITEAPLETCDICGGPVRRLLSAAPFILKGEGWYVTDYPSEARKKAAKAESPLSDSSAAPADTSEKSSTSATPSSSSPSSGDSAKSDKPAKPDKPAKSDKPAKPDKPASSAAS
jgi:putative FmdB family regulatory protein